MATAIAIFGEVFLLRFIHNFLTGVIPRILTRPSSNEKKIAVDIKGQRQQIHLIDPQNEFAKFARLQRQIKKWEDELSKKATERQKRGLKIKGALWIISICLSVCCHFWLVWSYRTLPVVQLPSEWLYPLNAILKFPTDIDGAIGLPCWLFISNSVTLLMQSL